MASIRTLAAEHTHPDGILLGASGEKLGMFGTTPVAQPAHIADVTITATTGTLPTPNGAVTIADAAAPTVVELQEAVVELNAKITEINVVLAALGITASS